MLGALGLDPDEEVVYRALLSRPSATVTQIVEALESSSLSSEPKVAEALARLEQRGLVNRAGVDGYCAAPPAVALGALITERREALRMAEHTLVMLAEEHRAAVAGQTIGELIEVITGTDAIRHRFTQLQHAARTELRVFITAPFVAVPLGQNAAEPAAVERGVRFRGLLERSVLQEPGGVEEAIDSLNHGVELRVADHLPMKLAIADTDLALVPLTVTRSGTPGAVLLHRSGLLTAVEALFEAVWHRAHPLELPKAAAADAPIVEVETDQLTDLDRRIVSLLIAGLSDQAVAAQLDLSLRSLQRRLRHLTDLAGVRSRMQLGWYASQQGWVHPG